MDNERTVILENVGDQSIGLADTQGRMYRLSKGAKMRISRVSLQDILDFPGSRIIFREGLAQVSNVTAEELFNMGLTEDEINQFLDEPKKPTIVVKENLEDKAEKVITIEKPVEKKTTAKKTTTKKTTTKKSA
jgi:hypothetical protein